MSDWHVFATLWLRLLIWVEIKTLNHQTQENHWTTKHSWFWKAGSEAKIKPRHKRLIMRWKIIADNGIVKFMQFPETKEATTGEGVEAARSNDEKFCRRFVSFVRNALNANSTKQTIPLIPCMVGFDVWSFANLWQRFQSVKHLTSSSSGPHLIFFHYNTFSNIFEKKISLNPDILRYIWRNATAIGISGLPWGSSDVRGKKREIHVCLNISRCISQKTF